MIEPQWMNQIRSKYNKYFDRNAYRLIREHKTWIVNLPSAIIDLILKRLDHFSLIQLSNAYPQLRKIVLKPIYWYNLRIDLDESILRQNELVMITKFLEPLNNEICVELRNLKQSYLVRDKMQKRLLCHRDVRKVKIKFVKCTIDIEQTCHLLKGITHLDITYSEMNNTHLIQIANNITFLVSLMVRSKNIIDSGLEYFLTKSENLEGFGFFLPSTSDKY